jgi:hypothetical protein
MPSDFLAEVDAFLATYNVRPTRFGEAAVGDRSFVSGLRNGRSPRLITVDRVRAYMTRFAAPYIEAAARDHRNRLKRAARARRKEKSQSGPAAP